MKYYSEIADQYNGIPLGVVHKGFCGCGMTSYALENDKKTVVIVPTCKLVDNKVEQYPNNRRSERVLGVQAGVGVKEIESYLSEVEVPKIIVTWDSFSRICDLIDSSWHVVIDEFQELVDSYHYRSNAVTSLIECLSLFPKKSYISATPLDKEFLPEALRAEVYTKIEWDTNLLERVEVIPHSTKYVVHHVVKLIEKYKVGAVRIGDKDSNAAYFFIDSLKLITEIINKSRLKLEEYKIVCSDHSKSKIKQYRFGSLNEPETRFTFLTKAVFNGCDIYSKSGMTYVVSNHSNIHTLKSIDTEIVQIAGRIRNLDNPFRNMIYHIFSENPLSMSEEEYQEGMIEKIEDSKNVLSGYGHLVTIGEKRSFLKMVRKEILQNNLYLRILNDEDNDKEKELVFDEIGVLCDERIYKDVIQVYQSGISILKSYETSSNHTIKGEEIELLEYMTSDYFAGLCRRIENGKLTEEQGMLLNPLIKEALPVLGLAKMKALDYRVNKIKKHLANNMVDSQLIKSNIETLFRDTKGFISSKEIKNKLQRIYRDTGVSKTAKANEIENHLDVKYLVTKIDGKSIAGYVFK